jgi:septum formation protein
VVPSTIEEELSGEPVENAEELAGLKTEDVFVRNSDALVIGADTIVFAGEKSYGKPADEQEVFDMWRELRGKAHQVVTAFMVRGPDYARLDSDVSTVQLRDLDDDTILQYAASGRPLDKAGAYAIQDDDVPTVGGLSGCYCSVMGLPLYWLKQALEEAGVTCNDPAATREICRDCGSRP